jgi:hypothetical protein
VKRLYRQAADGTLARGCTRRAFLLAALVSVAGGVPLTSRGAFAAASLDAWRPPAWLAGITGERDAVMRLGQAYRQSRPAEQASDVLAEAVDRALTSELDGGTRAADPLQVIAALRRVVRAEYARGEVVEVQGWVLSTTEARLYGLVAALSGGWPGTGSVS